MIEVHGMEMCLFIATVADMMNSDILKPHEKENLLQLSALSWECNLAALMMFSGIFLKCCDLQGISTLSICFLWKLGSCGM